MKIGFVSLGCPKNLVDSEVMMGLLAERGCEITPHAEDADVLVVNTCSFIQPAQQESVQAILEMAEYKRSGRARRLIVAGCLVERYREEILRQIPEVDALVGTGEVEQIVEAALAPEQQMENGRRVGPPAEPPRPDQPHRDGPPRGPARFNSGRYLYHDATPRLVSTPRHSTYIKINEGCDHPCTFCIIPQLRGRFRSREPASVEREAAALVRRGAREITLVGQDTTAYGEDLGLRDALPSLLERLAGVEGLAWVRFLYCYPNRVTPRLLETIAAHPRLANYLDIPLQHASRSVLARMKRGSHGDAFLKLLERIRQTIPGVMLRSSFIVGFPGETEGDFRELCSFVEAAEFDWLGVFAYSDEETAQSWHLPEKVDPAVIAERRERLMALQKNISRRRLRARAGESVVAMLDGPSRESEFIWEARTEGMAAEIDGKIYLTDLPAGSADGRPARPGDLVRVRIDRAAEYDLIGRAVELLEPARAREPEPLLRVLG
jgi:ribosomal protein S12 methylthiotransferase